MVTTSFKLNNGLQMPALGLGMSLITRCNSKRGPICSMAGEGQFEPARQMLMQISGTWQSPAGQVKAAVSYALQNGYKLIDGAYCYGNEDEVGEGLKEAFAAGVKREDIFVVTKVWATYNTRVAEALDKSLKSLGLEYVDALLVVS